MSELGIVLRAYRAEDEADVLRVWWDSWHSIGVGLTHPDPVDGWRERWTTEIVPAQRVVVAESEHAIAGFAALDLTMNELTQLFVAPAAQRRGIGVRLLDWAKASLPSGFTLSTLVENGASRAFYENCGLVAGPTRFSAINGRPVIEYRWRP